MPFSHRTEERCNLKHAMQASVNDKELKKDLRV